jgi:hypothetical protein
LKSSKLWIKENRKARHWLFFEAYNLLRNNKIQLNLILGLAYGYFNLKIKR